MFSHRRQYSCVALTTIPYSSMQMLVVHFLRGENPIFLKVSLCYTKYPSCTTTICMQLKKTMVVASINKVERACRHIKAWPKQIMHDVSLNI
jgi:hypothetical protein